MTAAFYWLALGLALCLAAFAYCLVLHRQRSAAFWTGANKTNPHYGLDHVRAFYYGASFRRLLLPKTRAHVQALFDAAEAAWRRDLRESMDRARLAKAPPMPLFT